MPLDYFLNTYFTGNQQNKLTHTHSFHYKNTPLIENATQS